MDRRYKHLNGEDRGVILAEHRRGASLGAIGLLLGCRASTIGRDLGVVASQTVVWLFLEQRRFQFVPVFHGLQGRLAAEG